MKNWSNPEMKNLAVTCTNEGCGHYQQDPYSISTVDAWDDFIQEGWDRQCTMCKAKPELPTDLLCKSGINKNPNYNPSTCC